MTERQPGCRCRGCELDLWDELNSESALLSDITEAFWSTILMRDWMCAAQWWRSFLYVMAR